MPLGGRAADPAVARTERTPGDGLGHLVLGEHEPRRSARPAEPLDDLDVDAGVAAQPALGRRHAHREQARVAAQGEVGRIHAACGVVGRGGVRDEHVAGEPGDGADGGVLGDGGFRGEQRLDGGSGTRLHEPDATRADAPARRSAR